MQQTLAIQNLKCGGCAHTIETSVEKAFGAKPTVDVEAGTVSLDLSPEREQELHDLLHKLGYPVVGDPLGRVDAALTAAKSYVSCAIGRVT